MKKLIFAATLAVIAFPASACFLCDLDWDGKSVNVPLPPGDTFNRCAFGDSKKMGVKAEIRQVEDQYRLILAPADAERLHDCSAKQMQADMAAVARGKKD
ncbi:MAG: hypothetical protein M1547_03100 [Gammaproteobacteria bacterium]|nr:hypothetical protein [Gammaproteobacteria bacterium]